MSLYHCNEVARHLQGTTGVVVSDKDASSWQFQYQTASLNLRVMPGCCGILVLFRIHGKDAHAYRLIRAALQAARKANFGMVVLSLLDDSPLIKRFNAEEWGRTSFQNPRTLNHVSVLTYRLPIKIKPKAPATDHEDS